VSSGRCVRIEHAGGIVSIYGHLSKITPGLAAGSDVRVEQVIGRVGTSGLSTGPHLHYAIEKDGRYVNPLTQSMNAPHRISPRMRVVFDRFKQKLFDRDESSQHLRPDDPDWREVARPRCRRRQNTPDSSAPLPRPRVSRAKITR